MWRGRVPMLNEWHPWGRGGLEVDEFRFGEGMVEGREKFWSAPG